MFLLGLMIWLAFVAVTCWLIPRYRQCHRAITAARGRLADLAATIEQARRSGTETAQEMKARDRELAVAYAGLQSEQFNAKWREIPLEDLCCRGIGNKTIALLRAAGMRRVADVAGTAGQVVGVGPQLAMLISHRLDYLRRRVNDEVSGEPADGLPNPGDLRLARASLNVLLADPCWTTAGRQLERAASRLQEIISRHQDRLDKSGLIPRGRAVAMKVVDDALAELHTAGLESCLEQANQLAQVVAQRTSRNGRGAVGKLYAQHKAEVLDLLLRRFQRRKIHGSLAENIARKVEATDFRPVVSNAQLRSYQEFGCRFVLQQRRVLLGDQMGLGKSLQAIAVATHLKAKNGKLRAFVVAPASLLENWRREAIKFSDLKANILAGTTLDEDLHRFIADGDLAITSFETCWMKVMERLPHGFRLDLLVVDEAHMIKSPTTRRTRACIELMRRAQRVLLMTGTPLENRLDELVQLVEHIQPCVAEAIRRRARERGGGAMDETIAPAELSELVAPVYLRRRQVDVLRELPPCIETEEWVTLTEADKESYRQAVMRRSYPCMRTATTIGAGMPGVRSAKVKRLDEILSGHRGEGRRVVVFSFFLSVLRHLRQHLRTDLYISGEIPASKRQQVVDEFSGRPGFGVLLAQISSCGIGLNVQAASVVVITEPQFKPSVEQQAIARVYRMGQQNVVHVHRLLGVNTVDSHLHARLQVKAKIAEDYSDESRLAAVSLEAGRGNCEASFAQRVVELESRRPGRRAA